MAKKIVHIDLNAFFAQCEVNRDRTLKGKPIAVGSNGKRGVVSTSSYEARKFKVFSGMSMAVAKSQCPDLIVIPGDYKLYAAESSKFFSYLKKRFLTVEQASIDECYIDMTPELEAAEDERDYLLDLQLTLFKVTSLKCSIGLGDNRFLAKMASDLKKPMGLTIIHLKDVPKLLWPLSVKDMYGIGKKTFPKLEKLGIRTIGDLALTNDSDVRNLLGSSFESAKAHANGYGNDVVDPSPFDPKSVGASRTFADDTADYDEIKAMIVHLSAEVGAEMQKYHKISATCALTLRDQAFVTRSKQMSLNRPTAEAAEIAQTALIILDRFWNQQPIRLVGVSMLNVKDEKEGFRQLELFGRENYNSPASKPDEANPVVRGLLESGQVGPASKLLKRATKNKESGAKKEPHYKPFRGLEE